EHAVGELQLGFGQRVRRGGRGKVRHRIVARREAIGGRVLQPRDHALRNVVEASRLNPDRRVVPCGIEFLDRRTLALVLEIAQRFRGQQLLELVGDRLVGRRHVARGLHRLLGGLGRSRCGGGRSRRLDGGCRGSRRGGGRCGGGVALRRIIRLGRRGRDRGGRGRLGGLCSFGARLSGV